MGKRLIISEEERSEIRGKYNLITEGEMMPLPDYFDSFKYTVCKLPQSELPFIKGKSNYKVICNKNKNVYFLYFEKDDHLESLIVPNVKKFTTFYGDKAYDMLKKYQ
jgi:hypothetical protein